MSPASSPTKRPPAYRVAPSRESSTSATGPLASGSQGRSDPFVASSATRYGVVGHHRVGSELPAHGVERAPVRRDGHGADAAGPVGAGRSWRRRAVGSHACQAVRPPVPEPRRHLWLDALQLSGERVDRREVAVEALAEVLVGAGHVDGPTARVQGEARRSLTPRGRFPRGGRAAGRADGGDTSSWLASHAREGARHVEGRAVGREGQVMHRAVDRRVERRIHRSVGQQVDGRSRLAAYSRASTTIAANSTAR